MIYRTSDAAASNMVEWCLHIIKITQKGRSMRLRAFRGIYLRE